PASALRYGAPALLTHLVMPRCGWRGVFFVGVLPALLTVLVQYFVEAPRIWRPRTAGGRSAGRFSELFEGGRARVTAAVTAMNACTLFAWWGLNSWVPA